jgi:hypothetical protein
MFRFTIRDVLWLMVVVGLGAAWFFDRSTIDNERARHRERAIAKELALYDIGHALTYPCDQLDLKELQKVINKAIAE